MALYKSLKAALEAPEDCTALKLTVKGRELPPELLELPALRELYLEAPELLAWPELKDKWTELRLLSVRAPKLKEGVAPLLWLARLENLKVHETPLHPFLIKLTHHMAPLESLTLKACGIKELPLEFGELTQLTELYLPQNQLKELPFTFGGLQKLKRLNLDSNAFKTLPELIRQLGSLLHLSIDGNAFSDEEKERIQRHFGLTPN